MKLPTLFCIAIWMAMCGSPTQAQEAAAPTPRPTPPSEPLLKQAPDFAAWTIVRQSIPSLGSQPPDAVMKAVATANKPDSLTTVTKTGSVRHQATTTKERAQEDIWYEHGNRIVMESVWKMPMFERASSLPNQPTGPDFPEVAWITPKSFVGTQTVGEATYFVFEAETTEGDAAAAKAFGYKLKTTHNRAFIDADTRLPWVLQMDNVLQRYVFQAAPTAMQAVPAEYQTMFDNYEKKKAESARKPVAP